MKKLGLLFVVVSMLFIVPKVASAFTLLEVRDVDIPQFALWPDGTVKVDIVLSKDQATALGVDKLESVSIPQFARVPLAMALSNASNLKGTTYIHMILDDDGAGGIQMNGFSIGKYEIPAYQ